jgi:thiamine biosynthesis protein ThiS
VRILVNGEPKTVRPQATVADLLVELKVSPQHVAVEINRQLVPRRLHGETRLAEGDEMEVVTLVGGG